MVSLATLAIWTDYRMVLRCCRSEERTNARWAEAAIKGVDALAEVLHGGQDEALDLLRHPRGSGGRRVVGLVHL